MGKWASSLEGMVETMSFWNGKKVLITGHTGFKGSWLSLWLQKLGADVTGFSLLPPTKTNMFDICKVQDNMHSVIGDVRDIQSLGKLFTEKQPEIVFHLAAQPLVRKSYENPVETFDTNIMGLVNLLEVARHYDSVKAVIIITSDKCYDNKEWLWGYRETDPVGGHDPYSCSKGCVELIVDSFRRSFYKSRSIALATVRAGNVIGGGDWAEDRLVPDLVSTIIKNECPILRNPGAVRPWQLVIEPLYGYMQLAEKIWDNINGYSEAWNIGPGDTNIITVMELTQKFISFWGVNLKPVHDETSQPHEAQLLKLDCSKARTRLGWTTILNSDDTVKWTVDWYKGFVESGDMRDITLKQISTYEEMRIV